MLCVDNIRNLLNIFTVIHITALRHSWWLESTSSRAILEFPVLRCFHIKNKCKTVCSSKHALPPFSSFPQATNQTLLDKFKRQHEGNSYIEFPAVMEPAFIIRHYAGKVKYGVKVSATFTRISRSSRYMYLDIFK